jgi:hypothetical protein
MLCILASIGLEVTSPCVCEPDMLVNVVACYVVKLGSEYCWLCTPTLTHGGGRIFFDWVFVLWPPVKGIL